MCNQNRERVRSFFYNPRFFRANIASFLGFTSSLVAGPPLFLDTNHDLSTGMRWGVSIAEGLGSGVGIGIALWFLTYYIQKKCSRNSDVPDRPNEEKIVVRTEAFSGASFKL